jgi:hypothetical protein
MRNYWIDVVMALLALSVGVSALLLWVVFPQGYFAARLLWVEIHRWTGLALSVVVLVHVLFHWRWIGHMTRRVLSRFREWCQRPARSEFGRQNRDWT